MSGYTVMGLGENDKFVRMIHMVKVLTEVLSTDRSTEYFGQHRQKTHQSTQYFAAA